jgi:hypothetical protein
MLLSIFTAAKQQLGSRVPESIYSPDNRGVGVGGVQLILLIPMATEVAAQVLPGVNNSTCSHSATLLAAAV